MNQSGQAPQNGFHNDVLWFYLISQFTHPSSKYVTKPFRAVVLNFDLGGHMASEVSRSIGKGLRVRWREAPPSELNVNVNVNVKSPLDINVKGYDP